MLADLRMSRVLHQRGALKVYKTPEAFLANTKEWNFKCSLGRRWRSVDSTALRELESNLAPVFKKAAMLEDWAYVDDPVEVVFGLTQHVYTNGTTFGMGSAAHLVTDTSRRVSTQLLDGLRIECDLASVAAGTCSAKLARSAGDHTLLESVRGYKTTLPESSKRLYREAIFAGKMLVATPLPIGLRVDGAADFAGLRTSPNYQRSNAHLKLANCYLPGLDESDAKWWMGHRPATLDSLPVIGHRQEPARAVCVLSWAPAPDAVRHHQQTH